MWWRLSNDNGFLYDAIVSGKANLRSQNRDSNVNIKVHQPVENAIKQDIVKKLRVAFAITITKDGSFQDGAAVLAYSIFSTNMTNEFDVSLVAFVHPNVTTSRPILWKIGYHVIEVPTPINTTAIQFEFLRTKINKNGCCGAAELIKLSSYRLTQYDVVVHMDADTFFANSIGELFSSDKSLIYTTDPNMATFKMDYKQPAQGGFLVMKPSIHDYKELINIMLTTDFVMHRGWNYSEVGWFWGGMTVQGVLPYYYNIIAAPNRSLKINRCIYNTMADTPECKVQSLQEIKSAHFTVCQKPWTCQRHHDTPLCGVLHEEWFRLRQLAEKFYSIPSPSPPHSESNLVQAGACSGKGKAKGGGGRYIPMQLNQAVTPSHIFLPDDSPDELTPIGNSGFVSSEAAAKVKWN